VGSDFYEEALGVCVYPEAQQVVGAKKQQQQKREGGSRSNSEIRDDGCGSRETVTPCSQPLGCLDRGSSSCGSRGQRAGCNNKGSSLTLSAVLGSQSLDTDGTQLDELGAPTLSGAVAPLLKSQTPQVVKTSSVSAQVSDPHKSDTGTEAAEMIFRGFEGKGWSHFSRALVCEQAAKALLSNANLALSLLKGGDTEDLLSPFLRRGLLDSLLPLVKVLEAPKHTPAN